MQDPFVRCSNCKISFPMLDIEAHYRDCLKPTQKCKWCDQIFSATSGGMATHRKKVHYWGVFKCPAIQCKSTSYFVEDLIKHMQEAGHTLAQNANCPHCHDEQSLPELKDHYIACVASGWKMGKCSKCKKRFPKKELLNHEEKKHLAHFVSSFFNPPVSKLPSLFQVVLSGCVDCGGRRELDVRRRGGVERHSPALSAATCQRHLQFEECF